jgi:hypothetical protein
MAANKEEFTGMAYRAGKGRKEFLWPTPRNNRGPSKDKRHLSLDGAVRLWPTPGTHGLSNGSGNVGAVNKLHREGKVTEEERRSMRSGNGGQINADWVEALMGYPRGWTDAGREAGTENPHPEKWLDGTWEDEIGRAHV